MKTMPPEMAKLIDVIAATFGSRHFDVASIVGEANSCPALADAIDAAVPHARFRVGHRRGRIRLLPLKAALEPHRLTHFDTDDHGWWCVSGGA
jgi:hypothetical protein